MNMLNSAKFTNLLKSRVVLWLLFVIALANMYAYLMSANEEYIAFILLSGFITSFFSKNMIVVLFFAICIPNILRFVMDRKYMQEGLVSNGEDDDTDTPIKKPLTEDKVDVDVDVDAELTKQLTKKPAVESQPAIQIPHDKLNEIQKKIVSVRKQVDKLPDKEISQEITDLLESQDNIITKLHSIGKKLSGK
jgi:hypothetical protein